MGVDTHY